MTNLTKVLLFGILVFGVLSLALVYRQTEGDGRAQRAASAPAPAPVLPPTFTLPQPPAPEVLPPPPAPVAFHEPEVRIAVPVEGGELQARLEADDPAERAAAMAEVRDLRRDKAMEGLNQAAARRAANVRR
jgi:hypothetical protein